MEKLFGIPAVMVMIYKNLTFADQLRLARVNSFLRSIFEDFIFPLKYTKLKITTLRKIKKILVSDNENEICMLLTDDEVKNFLQFGADKVEQMHVRSGLYKDPCIGHLVTFFCVEACGNFQSLTCLHCEEVKLSEKHLLLIAENSPKLSEFRLINCTNEATGEDLGVGRGVSISTLTRMNKLKSLRVHSAFVFPPIGMSLFFDLITNVPLECLNLTVLLKLGMQDNLLGESVHQHLKELELYLDAETLEFFKRAGILKNLVKLTVKLRHNVMDSVLATITKACENLECLTIGCDTVFKPITHFQMPPNLKELTLVNSQRLKQTHVIDILTKFKIEKLSCGIDGDTRLFKDLKMSPYIKVLDLTGINTIQFPLFYSNNNTLKELTLYEYGPNVPGATHNHEGLKSCKNLETLIVYFRYVPIDVVLELKHLQKLHFYSGKRLSWPYIIGLLTHSSLKEFYSEYCPRLREDATNIPAKGFPSTVTLVHINLGFLDKSLDFWLDMLQQNPTMLIRCDITFVWNDLLSFLKKLIQHDNIPMDLREVKVWGFNLNCKDLRKNFLATIYPLEEVKNSTYNNTLVLRRKQT